jgi:superfamily II DNA or RNA helicase
MPLFEIPSADGYDADIVFVRDQENPNDPVYTHYAFTRGSTANNNEIRQRRGIPLDNFRSWDWFIKEFPEIEEQLSSSREYLPGESVLSSADRYPDFSINTVMRLGALEVLANIFSGRITANDKDPFPHQLALQQYVRSNSTRVKRLLIADEVGLGKTIEIGLVLRDLLIAGGDLAQFRCLYLTKAGLLEDACIKLQAVMKGAIDGQNIVQVVSSFRDYGKNSISGIHVASIDAARCYVEERDKESLSNDCPISPDILIIDECHHCGSNEDLSSLERIKSATQTYKAVYQMTTGQYWQNSSPPKLVVLMSATPFRSKVQFVNLLRLLTHQSAVENAFSDITESELVEKLSQNESTAAVIWRQQNDVRSWSGQPLFPMLNVERVKLETSPEYLEIMKEICGKVARICEAHGESFGGFATRQLEMRLTSSSISGAMWLFRWCVRHQRWKTQEIYRRDTSESTENLRKLIVTLSQRLAEFDKSIASTTRHADVLFPSDNFNEFKAKILSQREGKINEIYKFSEVLHQKDDENRSFTAERREILELTNLALRLLNFSAVTESNGVENAKLNWLKEKLEQYPDSRFLVFTEVLQTCEIITKALPGICEKITGSMGDAEREKAVRKFRGVDRSPVRVLVATSAADEGFDFQVANQVVHWDLSSSPAVLMQRNGRVARLGQVADVTAHYLIMTGTHEERRELALHERFEELGIKDEQLRLRILGGLSEEREKEILIAVEENKPLVVNQILENASQQNKEMNQKLGDLQKKLDAHSVIDRKMLSERLSCWLKLGLPPRMQNDFTFKFDTVVWQRPVFTIGEKTGNETASATVAEIKKAGSHARSIKVTFDPEFNLFGSLGGNYSLAGLRPWTKRVKPSSAAEVWKHRPLKDVDSIGDLACSLARQRGADFTTISASKLREALPNLHEARYLLFATHPMLEVEAHPSENISYLTFYAFKDESNAPIHSQGHSADQVHKVISLLEDEVQNLDFELINSTLLKNAREASSRVSEWLRSSRILPGLGRQTYFLPIPVALVAVLP